MSLSARSLPARPAPPIGYKVQGKVGDTPVDLSITPMPVSPARIHGDPVRLARIRAARMPRIDKPILFDTPQADAICSALEVFLPDNPWARM